MKLSKLNVKEYGAIDKTDYEHALRDKLQLLEIREESLEELIKFYENRGYWKYVDLSQKQLVLVRSQVQGLKRKLHLQQ